MRYLTPWSDEFVYWLKKIPGPFWLSCSILGLLIFLINSYLYIIADFSTNPNSGLTQSSIIIIFGLLAFVPAYAFYILGGLSLLISSHLQKLRPILRVSDEEYEALHDQILLRSISSRLLWVGQRFALLISIITLISLWLTVAGASAQVLLFLILFFLSLLLLIFLSFIVLIKIGNVLRQIFRLQYQPLAMNILNPFPLFAISRLTQRLALYILPIATALGFIAISMGLSTWRAYASTGDLPSLGEMTILIPLILLGPSLLLISIFIFMFPVLWIRRLILEKKEEALDNLATRLQATFSEYTRRVANSEWANVSELTASVEFLTAQEERYRKIPEWPWEGRILREFLGALVIPVLLWVVQFYVEKYITSLAR